MRRLLLAALLVTAAVLTAAPAVSAQDDGAPTVVTLLSPGAAPRAPLRYVLAPGAEQQSVLTVGTSITQKIGDQDAASGRSPRIELEVSTTVGEPTQSAVTVTFSFDDVRVGGGASQSELEDALEPLVGFEVLFTMTNRGEILAADGDVPADLDSATAQLLDQFLQQARNLAVPLPEEAVGKGARWSARQELTISGIELRQTVRYELLRVTDDGVELEVTISQRAPRQTFTDPASGTEVELLSSRASGDGAMTIEFEAPIPIEAESHVQVKQRLRAEGDRIAQTVTADSSFEPA